MLGTLKTTLAAGSRSWQTTIAGVYLALAHLEPIFTALGDPETVMPHDWRTIVTEAFALVWLGFSGRDAGVSSEQSKAGIGGKPKAAIPIIALTLIAAFALAGCQQAQPAESKLTFETDLTRLDTTDADGNPYSELVPDPSITVEGTMATPAYKIIAWWDNMVIGTSNNDPFTVSLHPVDGFTLNGAGAVRAFALTLNENGIPQITAGAGDDVGIGKVGYTPPDAAAGTAASWFLEDITMDASSAIEAQAIAYREATTQFQTKSEDEKQTIIETTKELTKQGEQWRDAFIRTMDVVEVVGPMGLRAALGLPPTP